MHETGGKPALQALQSIGKRGPRAPTCRGRKRADIGDVPGLVARSPIVKAVLNRSAGCLGDELDQLKQADGIGGATTKIENPALGRVDIIEHSKPRIDRIR